MTHNNSTLAGLDQRNQTVTALMAVVAGILLIQLWSMTVAVQGHLAARAPITWPAFGAALFCLAVNLGLLKYLYGLDRKKG